MKFPRLMEQLVAAPELTTGHQFKDVLTKIGRERIGHMDEESPPLRKF